MALLHQSLRREEMKMKLASLPSQSLLSSSPVAAFCFGVTNKCKDKKAANLLSLHFDSRFVVCSSHCEEDKKSKRESELKRRQKRKR